MTWDWWICTESGTTFIYKEIDFTVILNFYCHRRLNNLKQLQKLFWEYKLILCKKSLLGNLGVTNSCSYNTCAWTLVPITLHTFVLCQITWCPSLCWCTSLNNCQYHKQCEYTALRHFEWNLCWGKMGGGKKGGGLPPPRPFHKIVKMCSTDPKIFWGRLLRTFRSHKVRFLKSTWITPFFDAFKKKKYFFFDFLPCNDQMRCIFRKIYFSPKDFFSRDRSIQSNRLKTFFVMKYNYAAFRASRKSKISLFFAIFCPQG